MPKLTSLRALAFLFVLSAFLSKPTDTKIWLTSADGDVLRFSVPEEYRRGGNAYAGLMFFGMLVFLYLFCVNPQGNERLLYVGVPLALINIAIIFDLFSLSEIIINLQGQTYETISCWLWRTEIHQGSLDDFRAVYVSDRNSVSLVYKKPGLLRRVLPIGSAGFGADGPRFAQEVGRRTGLEVVTSLSR